MVPADEFRLREALGEAHRRYTRMINLREGWKGHLWQERFHSLVMDEQHLLAAARYVELDPAGARFCAQPQDWPWSSAAAYLGAGDDALVSVGPLLDLVPNWVASIGEDKGNRFNELARGHAGTGRLRRLRRVAGAATGPVREAEKPGLKPQQRDSRTFDLFGNITRN